MCGFEDTVDEETGCAVFIIINEIKKLQVGLVISFNTLKSKHDIRSLMYNYLKPSALSASSAVKNHE